MIPAALVDRLDEELRVDPERLGQGNRLGHRLDLRGEPVVENELQPASVPGRPKPERLAADRVEHRSHSRTDFVRAGLDRAIDDGLRSRADDVAAPRRAGRFRARPAPPNARFPSNDDDRGHLAGLGIEVEPSLYAADFANLGAQVDSLLAAGARVFHFDVGDGRFVEPVTMGPIVLESIAPLIHGRDAVVDCHLMVVEPEHHIPQLAAAGGDSVTFHVEATDDPQRAISAARALDLGVGVALNPDTPIQRTIDVSEGADFVLCMSIHPGYSGQRFMPESLERIAALRERLPDRVLVQVDGGIDEANAAAVADAGARLIVAGSAIFDRADIATAYRRLSEDVDSARSQG